MSPSKKLPVKGLCGRCLSVHGPEPSTPLPLTYSILVHIGKGRGGGTREKVRGATAHKAGSKIPT
jgi:hypothetical protein